MLKHKIFRSALILTLANIITRLLGFFYRIFMSKALGGEGMGLFQLINPVYMLVWAFSSAGISTTVSKLTAELKNKRGDMTKTLLFAVTASLALSLGAGILVFFNADYIACGLLKDIRVCLSLKIISLCFPFMAVGSCIRGWFYGLQEAAVPARCQVLEQCIRIGSVYILSHYMLDRGLEIACAMAVIGMALGEIIAFLYALFSMTAKKALLRGRASITYKNAAAMVLSMAIPLTLNRVTGTLLSSAESLLIPRRLVEYGLTYERALALYGKAFGMAMPLVMFPSSLLTALATALMPAVSEASAVGTAHRLSGALEKSLALTSVIGMGTAGLFISMPKEIGLLIYGEQGKGLGTILFMLGFICPLVYLQVTLTGILNGLGKQLYIFILSLCTSLLSIAIIYFFVPVYGLSAFIGGWFITALISTLADFYVIGKNMPIRLYPNNLFLKPFAAACLAFMSLKLITGCFDSTQAIICSIAFAGSLYLLLIMLLGVLKA